MKRIVTILLILGMTMSLLCCNPETGGECIHEYGEYIERIAPTCTSLGEEYRTCTKCGHEETRKINKLGHDFSEEFTIDVPSTCTEYGSKSRHCLRSGCTETTDKTKIPTLEHEYGEWIVDKAATCTEKGTKHRHCELCGNDETDTIEMTEHNWIEDGNSKPATCDEDGLIPSAVCGDCGATRENVVLPALGHDIEIEEVIKEFGCTKSGTAKVKCTRCTYADTVDIAALGHDYTGEYTVDREPTCYRAGHKTLYCARENCNEILDERLIVTKDHNWDKGTSTENSCGGATVTYHCQNEGCEEIKYESTGQHSFSSEPTRQDYADCVYAGMTEYQCRKCGAKKTVFSSRGTHNYGNREYVICKEPTTEECGYKYIKCDKCGEEKPNSRSEIKKIVPGKSMQFEITIGRLGGVDFYKSVTVHVYDGDEEVSSKATVSQQVKFTLPAKEYTVKITDLPRGYTASNEYILRPGVSNVRYELGGELTEGGEKPADYKYTTGDAAYNLSFTTYNDETYEVHDLLKQYKAILFNFYYIGCIYCNMELPYLMKAQKQFGNEVLVVFVNGYNENISSVMNHAKTNGFDKCMIAKKFLMDDYPDPSGDKIYGFPTNIILDCDGIFAEFDRGSESGDFFFELMEKYVKYANLRGWVKQD